MGSYGIRTFSVSHTFLAAVARERIVDGYRVKLKWIAMSREEAIARRQRVVQIVADALRRQRAAWATAQAPSPPNII